MINQTKLVILEFIRLKSMILTTALLLLVFSGAAHAGTCDYDTSSCSGDSPWTADSLSYNDVNYCVNTCASSGDTVNLPSGSATWTSSLTIDQPITIVGQTTGCPDACSDNTIISGNGSVILMEINAYGDEVFDISGLTLDGNGGSRVIQFDNDDSSTPTYDFRLHHNNIYDAEVCVRKNEGSGSFFGLMDNNLVADCTTYDIAIYGPDTSTPWTEYPGGDNQGTKNYFYIEDNVFTGGTRFIIASGRSCRWAFRHNDVTMTGTGYYTYFDFHGDVGNYGGVAMELYENEFDSNRGSIRFAHTHGGANIIYNNTAPSETGSMSISMEEQANNSGAGCLDPAHAESLPINNTYTWNNLRLTSTQFSVYEDDDNNCIEEDTDWWDDYPTSTDTNFDYDVAANRNASTCSTDDVYWETDNETLYRCTATNTWTEVFQPYTYPHPLVSGVTTPTPGSTFTGTVTIQ